MDVEACCSETLAVGLIERAGERTIQRRVGLDSPSRSRKPQDEAARLLPTTLRCPSPPDAHAPPMIVAANTVAATG
jgi:hypothetical protein